MHLEVISSTANPINSPLWGSSLVWGLKKKKCRAIVSFTKFPNATKLFVASEQRKTSAVSTLGQDAAPLAPRGSWPGSRRLLAQLPARPRHSARVCNSFRVCAIAHFIKLADQVKRLRPKQHLIQRGSAESEQNNCFPFINLQQIHS